MSHRGDDRPAAAADPPLPAPDERRRPPRILVVLPVLLAIGIGSAVAARAAHGSPTAAAAPPGADAPAPALVDQGRRLFVTGCSSCHGIAGKGLKGPDGSVRGPSLIGKGEAAAYFQLHTGRMPLGASNAIPVRKDPAYSDAEIKALVAYVGSLGKGPAIPDVNIARGDLAKGGELFRLNCAACHSATGAGGALSYGRAAPPLGQATDLDVGTAIRSGPGQMPRFDSSTLSTEQIDSIAKYVEYLRQPDDRGGLSLGRLGPIPEGFLIWVVGIGGLVTATGFIAKRNTIRRRARRTTS